MSPFVVELRDRGPALDIAAITFLVGIQIDELVRTNASPKGTIDLLRRGMGTTG